MLSAKHISHGFNRENLIFENLSLKIRLGEIVSIVGPSGIGKTTLLKCLAGKLQLLSGEIRVNEEVLLGPEDQLLPGHEDIALVDQDFSLDQHFSVVENLRNRLLHLSKEDGEDFVEELLSIFGLENIKNRPSKYISGGEKQRLSMACALAQEPKFILLDEPFSNLDVHLKKSIGSYLRKLQEIRNMGVILVTHDGVDALSWSDQIYFFKAGGKVRSYTPNSAYYSPKNLYEGRFFGQLNSLYLNKKQILFRPTQYSLKNDGDRREIHLDYFSTDFHGHFYANYFKLANGKQIVLYADKVLDKVEKVYV
jgi:iron(III) transport system ATP-binding protein